MGYAYGYGFGHTWKIRKKRGVVAPPAVGGGALLEGEVNGFATDFLYATDASRVALKSSGSTVAYAVDAFYANAGTSPKMVYDVAGVLGWSPHNLLLRSSEFDNAVWNKGAATIAANAVAAPNGAMEADALIPNNGGALNVYCYVDLTNTAGVTYTYSVYAKNGTLGNNWVYFEINLNSGNIGSSWFNLATGAKGMTFSPVAIMTSNITSVGSGWYRLGITFTAEASFSSLILRATTGDGVASGGVTGDGVKPACYLWGAQINRGTTPTAYLPTTTAARVGLALDYDPVTHAAKGLLCEPAATNLCLQSQAFEVTPWLLFTATLSANAIAAPDGTTTADKLVETAVTDVHKAYQAVSNLAGAYTASVYAKAGGRDWFYIKTYDGGNLDTYFNVTTGAVGAIAAGCTATITAVGNGWYRCAVSRTMTNMTYLQIGTASANGTDSFAGDITKGVYLWGAQIETGTVATSHIPTLAATVTRAADQVSVTPSSINHSATAGSWWAEINALRLVSGNDQVVGYTTAGMTPIYLASLTQFGLYDGTVGPYKVVASTLGTRKVAAAFASADRALTADGLAPITDATAGIAFGSPGASIGFGCSGGGINQMHGYIRKLRYLPRRPTNAELQTMTT